MTTDAIAHRWDVTPAEARAIQNQLRSRVRQRNGAEMAKVRYVAGVDISIRGGRAAAAIPVLEWETFEVVDLAFVELPVTFPYVPGLLSFREIPSILAAYDQLAVIPDVLRVDGQGIAPPRRFGLASHLGVLLDRPTIGCAKSRYIGEHDMPHEEAGSYVDLIDDGQLSHLPGELIGAVLRTRTNVKPIYVSIGHQIDLPTAIDLTWNCCTGYRLPEPTRLAHQAAGGTLSL
jgi:deoxyribonuclease V